MGKFYQRIGERLVRAGSDDCERFSFVTGELGEIAKTRAPAHECNARPQLASHTQHG